MLLPVRCYTCNAVVAHKWGEFRARQTAGDESTRAILDGMGFTRMCCRVAFVCHIIDDEPPATAEAHDDEVVDPMTTLYRKVEGGARTVACE